MKHKAIGLQSKQKVRARKRHSQRRYAHAKLSLFGIYALAWGAGRGVPLRAVLPSHICAIQAPASARPMQLPADEPAIVLEEQSKTRFLGPLYPHRRPGGHWLQLGAASSSTASILGVTGR